MKNPKKLLLIILVFALLLGSAYVLYERLGSQIQLDQLSTQPVLPPQDSTPQSQPQGGETQPQDSEPQTPETLAPDFTVYDADGNVVHLSDYFGKPIVLNFWASWCGPCQMEMPDFQEKYLELGDEIQFLMINMTDGYRETVDVAAAFIAEQGYTFPVFYDQDSDAASTYAAYSLPMTFFIDAQGYAVAQAVGAIDAETLQQGIDMITG